MACSSPCFRFGLMNNGGRLLWLVDDIADLLDRVDVAFVFGSGDDDKHGADPIIHFYEPFLAAYDLDIEETSEESSLQSGWWFRSSFEASIWNHADNYFLEDGLASTGDMGRHGPTTCRSNDSERRLEG